MIVSLQKVGTFIHLEQGDSLRSGFQWAEKTHKGSGFRSVADSGSPDETSELRPLMNEESIGRSTGSII